MCLGAGFKRIQKLTVELMVKKNFYFGRKSGRHEGRKAGRKEGSAHSSPNQILRSLVLYFQWNGIVNQTI